MTLLSHELGKTITTTGANIQIFWHPFNPYIPDGTGTGLTNVTNTYDCSTLSYGHEVVCAHGIWDETNGHYITFRKGSTELFTKYYSGFSGMFVYIGIDYDEIITSGSDYYADFGTMQYSSDEGYYGSPGNNTHYIDQYQAHTFYANVNVGDVLAVSYYTYISGTITFLSTANYTVTAKSNTDANWDRYTIAGLTPSYPSGGSLLCFMYKWKSLQTSHNFTVTNVPSYIEATAGMIWVEGDNICYIGAEKTTTGYKHKINHDGNTYGWWATPGMIWVDQANNGKIAYTDSSGILRKTHTGDPNGKQWGNEVSITGATPGKMWVSTPEGNYAYLTFIAYNGQSYRIMNGQV